MKHFAFAALVFLLLSGAVGAAQAVEVKASGQWDFAFGWAKNTSFYKYDHPGNENYEDIFNARQRVRTQLDLIISDRLNAVVQFEIGDIAWGNDLGKVGSGSGGGLGGDGVNVETRHAYLQWMIPGTEAVVRMGLQHLSLPSGTDIGNPILGNDVAGISLNLPLTDTFGLTAFWIRPFDADGNVDGGRNIADEMDMFAVTVPITGNGWGVTPWGAYARIGSGSGAFEYLTGQDAAAPLFGDGNSANAWWLGLALQAELTDALTFGADAIYGRSGRVSTYFQPDGFKTAGWFLDANLNYALDWGTPGIFGWWSSGDTEAGCNDGRGGRLLSFNNDDGFAATSFGFTGTAGIGNDTTYSSTGFGTWGVGLQAADMSFLEGLSHTVRVAYYRGTNDSGIVRSGREVLYSFESIYLTDKDYAVEVNFDHSCQIYENLTAFLELGYINMNLDELGTAGRDDTRNAWKAQLLFQFSF